MTRIIVFMAMALCLWQEVQGQDDPCLRFSDEAPNVCPSLGLKTIPIQAVSLTHNFKREGLTKTDSARYKAFWILGDGNFVSFPDKRRAADDEASLDLNYIYNRPGNYNIRSVLIEKKSNGQPPGSDLRKAKIEGTTTLPDKDGQAVVGRPPLPGTAFNSRIIAPNRADILNSEKVRLGGYETVFVTSSKLPTPNSNQVILFFYNSLRFVDSTNYQKGDLFPKSLISVEKANYTPDNFGYVIGTSANLTGALQRAANGSQYGNFIAQTVNVDFNLKPENFTEFRIFPVLKTKTRTTGSPLPYSTGIRLLDSLGKGETQFLTLVLENATINKDTAGTQLPYLLPVSTSTEIIPLDTAEQKRILKILRIYFPALAAGIDTISLKISDSDLYVRSVAYRSTAIVSSIDPTSLDVLKICPTGDNKYDVSMKLSICNEGNLEEPHVGVKIYNTKNIQILDPVFQSQELSQLDSFSYNPTSNIRWSFAYMKGLPGVYNTAGDFSSNCISQHFNFKTDWAGVQSLQTGGGLTAKVTFHSALIKPTQDFPTPAFDENESVTQELGYKCGDPNPKNCWWLYVVLFALGLVAWWYWKMKKEDEMS
jgi:hypothetical protein